MANTFAALLESWIGAEVTVINPESFKSTALGKGLTFQSYPAKVSELGSDFVKLTFSAIKKDSETQVEQIVPIDRIKRISVWGDEKLIHL